MSAYSFLFLFTFLTSLSLSVQQQRPEYVGFNCSSRTYLKNSKYSSNLKTLLLSLSSKDFSYGFQGLNTGDNEDTVFVVFLCRGDLSPETCGDCVSFAVNDTLNQCPDGKEALIYYSDCMLRYSDRDILAHPLISSGKLLVNDLRIAANQLGRFNKILFSLLNDAAEEAASIPRKFAAKKANFTSSQTVYVVAQCTPDLRKENCSSCLQRSISQLPRDRIGGRLLWPSCNLRYELYRFYNQTLNATLPPPPLQQPGKSSPIFLCKSLFQDLGNHVSVSDLRLTQEKAESPP